MSNPETRQVFEGSGEAPKNRIQQVLENIRRMLEKIAQQKKEREQAPKSPKISNEVKKLIENRPTAAENRELYEKVNPIANKREKNAFFGGERVDKQTLEKIEAKRQEKLDPDGERGGTVVDIVDQARESQKKRLSGKQRMDAQFG
jgi:ATPase subunit of ABC transporter with duplicated ATPase domains